MAAFKMIFVLLLLSISTVVNAIPLFGGRFPILKKPFPFNPAPKPAPKPTPKPTKPPPFSPVKDSRYCDESEISTLLSDEGRKKRAVLWPYDCKYPSIVNDGRGSYQFMYSIYSCCKACDFPTYSKCVKTFGSPDWRCPSDGVHCILKCVTTYGPGYTRVVVKPGITGITNIGGGWGTLGTNPGKGSVIKVPKKVKCEKIEKLANGKTCIRRLCVPLKTN